MCNLAGIISSRAWKCLLEIQQRLDVAIEVVDDRLTPLLPALDGRKQASARHLVHRLDDESLRAVIGGAMESLAQEHVTVRGVTVACTPIVGTRGRAEGVLLVADDRSERNGSGGDSTELERIGSWLGGAIEFHLTTGSGDDPSRLFQLSSLCRLLNQAVATGREREVIRTFLEALAVWEDRESWAYLRDLTGQFSLEVSLPGSDCWLVPAIIEEAQLPAEATIVRLAEADRKWLGFDGSADVIRVRGQSRCHWLIVARGDTETRREAQLTVYAHAAGRALGEASAVESSRLTWAMLEHLLAPTPSLERAAHDALGEVSAVLDEPACLTVRRSDGLHILTVGDPTPALSLPPPVIRSDVLVLPVDVASPYTAVISISRSIGRTFTPRDEKLLSEAAATLSAWLNTTLHPLASGRERRTAPRSFDQIIERYADQAIARRGEISVIVLNLEKAAPQPDLAHGLIGSIRPQLRVTDLAGRLISGDMAILLPDTSIGGAQAVAARVRRLIASDVALGESRPVAIGLACCAADSLSPQSLLRHARASADAGPVGDVRFNR